MSVLVMDGVRRPRRAPAIVDLAGPKLAATALDLPQPLSFGAALDGLRPWRGRPADTAVVEDLSVEAVDTATQTTDWQMPVAVSVGAAAIPMLMVAGALASQTVKLQQSAQPIKVAAKAPALTVAAAQPPAAAPAVAASQSLQQLLDGMNLSGTYSLYVKDLKSGQLATVGPDRSFESASLYKLFVANGIYQAIDGGQLSYGGQAGGGTGNSIAGCLNLMITISDNGCGQALGGLLGWSQLTQATRAQGYEDTNLTGEITYTTPRDVATLYERLYAGTLVSNDSTSNFMNLLKAQKVNNRLPQGLPAGTTFAHKTGDLDGYMHDAGIVFGPKTDYLVVMMGAPGATPSDFRAVSQILYCFFNQ